MKKGIVLAKLIFCLVNLLPAQSAKISSNLKLAYNGSIIYPGFRAGIEYPIKQISVTQQRGKRPERHFAKLRYLSGEIGFYHHQTFHDNIYLLLGWQMRKQHPRGFFTEFSPAIGYSRTFLGGETYLVDDAGNIKLVKFAGYNYAILAIGGGCGYQFEPRLSAYFRPSLLTLFPSNNIIYIRPTLELGLIWQPKHFWQAQPIQLAKTKGKKA